MKIQEWLDSGEDTDRKGRLHSSIEIAGVLMHLEAYAITRTADGAWEFDAWPIDMGQVCAGFSIGRPSTTTIEGREYVLFAFPFED